MSNTMDLQMTEIDKLILQLLKTESKGLHSLYIWHEIEKKDDNACLGDVHMSLWRLKDIGLLKIEEESSELADPGCVKKLLYILTEKGNSINEE